MHKNALFLWKISKNRPVLGTPLRPTPPPIEKSWLSHWSVMTFVVMQNNAQSQVVI